MDKCEVFIAMHYLEVKDCSSLPSHHCTLTTRDFHSFILVEVLDPPRVSSGERLKEHQDACEKGMMEKSDVVEHT